MTENMVLSNTAPWPGAVLGGCASKLKHSSLARGRPRGLRSRADAQPGCTAASPLPVGGSGAGVSAFAEKCAFLRKRQLTAVHLPEKFHGQGSLVSYSPWRCKKLDMTEQLSTQASIFILAYTSSPTPILHPQDWSADGQDSGGLGLGTGLKKS